MKQLQELLSLVGKSAIVTGGGKGIGQGIAYRLAEAGAKVLIAGLDEAPLQKTVRILTTKGWDASYCKADVSSETDVRHMTEVCQERYGSIDILVNNAGIYPPIPISDMSVEQFERVMNVNLLGAFLTTKYAAEIMKQKDSGKIINITSISALHPSRVGLAHYDASKHGLWGFTKSSALELAPHNIWVNAIAPGGIDTPGVDSIGQGVSAMQVYERAKITITKIPMHRIGEIDEISKVALFLASDMSSYMTGEQIVVDGGALLN